MILIYSGTSQIVDNIVLIYELMPVKLLFITRIVNNNNNIYRLGVVLS